MHQSLVMFVLAALAALLWAPSGAMGAPSCRHDNDCDRGFNCADGVCAIACRGSGDCPAGSKCIHRACVEQPAPVESSAPVEPAAMVAAPPLDPALDVPADPLQACIFLRTEETRVRAKWQATEPARIATIVAQRNAACVRAGEEQPGDGAPAPAAKSEPPPAAPSEPPPEAAAAEPMPTPQPFGLPLGEPWPDPPPKAWQCDVLDTGTWACLTPPKPLRGVKVYAVHLHGGRVARIYAVFDVFKKDAYGVDVRARFAELVSGLAKYGEPERLDYLREGSIWSRPQDWSLGIHHGERVHAAVWRPASFRILLEVRPARMSSTNALVLRYEHTEVAEALDARRGADEADAL